MDPMDAEPADTDSTARLTRRELLGAGAGALAAVTVAACAPAAMHASVAPTPTPFALGRPATVLFDSTVPPALATMLTERLPGLSGIADVHAVTSLAASPDLVLTFAGLPSGYSAASVGVSPVTVISHLRAPVDNVSHDTLAGLLDGSITDWSGAGAPHSLPVRPAALAGLALPPSVRLAPGARSLPTADALLDYVRTQPGSLALVPQELADWTVRNLGVDGVYPAQGRGNVAASALLPWTLRLGVSHALAAKGLDARQLAAALAPALAAAVPVVDVAVAGDIMLGRGVNNKMLAYGDYLYPYRKIRDELQAADLRVANLECTVTDLVPVPTDPFTFTFVSAKRAIDGLAYAGLSLVTVANNHADGPGIPAFLDMIASLRQRNIAVIGGGANLAEARSSATLSAKNLSIALLGYDGILPQGPYASESTGGIAPIDLHTLPADIAAARERADLVIPYFHWGIEYTKDPTVEQQQAAHAAVDAGADMVLGVHPHWIQGIENYKGRLIIYSLGNFIFDQDWSRPTMEGMLLHLYWRGATLAGIRFVPVLDEDRCQPRPMSPAEAVGAFERMWSGTDMLAAGQHGPEPE